MHVHARCFMAHGWGAARLGEWHGPPLGVSLEACAMHQQAASTNHQKPPTTMIYYLIMINYELIQYLIN